MAAAVSQHVRHLGVFKNIVFGQTATNFLKIRRKHVSTASNGNIIVNRVEKTKLEQILLISYNFLVQTLICIISFA